MAPPNRAETSEMFGRGYRSGTVTVFNRRKSPQGLHSPFFFFTMCSGEAQGEVERRIIPAFSIAWNSALAAANLTGSRRRALANTGGPGLVRIWWRTSWRGEETSKPSEESTSENSANNLETHFGEAIKQARGGEDEDSHASRTQEEDGDPLKTLRPATSTSN